MARKDTSKAGGHRGFNDIAGFVLIALAVMLLLSQLSFDRNDVRSNAVPPNATIHNWIGPVGAYLANGLFFICGAGAFVLPILLLAYGLSNLIEFLGYLRRRKTWAVILFLSCLGFFDLYGSSLESLRRNLNAPYAGGQVGHLMNEWIFGHFGKPGATIIFVTAYLVSLVFLTNFRLGEWARMAWVSFRSKRGEEQGWTPEEKALARKAKDLEKQAKKLQDDAARERSGLGADLKPVPAPTVRDLSLPQPRIGKTTRPKTAEPEPEKEGFEGEVIPA